MLKETYTKNEVTSWAIPNYWDLIAIVLVFSVVILLVWHVGQMTLPYRPGDFVSIHLNPIYLPLYAVRTVLRLFIALFVSLVVTFIFGTLAAKNKHAERLIIPIVDVLQSMPVFSFLSITIPGFVFIFKNSMLGPECAAIFGIFTSQAWNMILSLYQGVKTVPSSLKEVASIFHLSSWQRFWKIDIPFSMPGLLWNMMISMSGSWFFVIACETFSVAGYDVYLPGIGSYISLAISKADVKSIYYAILCMLIVIFLYDQLLFRPLVYWAEKLKASRDDEEKLPRAWVITLFQQTKFLRLTNIWFKNIGNFFINFKPIEINRKINKPSKKSNSWFYVVIYYSIVAIVTFYALAFTLRFISRSISFAEMKHLMLLCVFTGARVITLVFLSSLIWVPIGVWIGMRPRISAIVQPIIQFAAAFPINLLFSVAAFLIISLKLNVEIWVSPLMILGTQWYILFNVIAGTMALPKDLSLAAANFKVRGFLWWRRFILPGIAPSFVTGAITATGGAWNASIIAENISWGNIHLRATGIGAYIQEHFATGDFPRIVSGTIAMCIMVLLINKIFWRPIYNIVIKKFKTD